MLSYVGGRQSLEELNAFLASIPFFASLDEILRLELASQLEPVHAAAGGVIIKQGDPGNGLFLVVSGRLRVSVASGGIERVLHDLGRGAIVGEVALLSDRPRSATVRAVRDSDLLLLRVPVFTSLAEQDPALLTMMARLLVDRLLTVDRPQAPPPAGRAIAVVAAGKSTGSAAAIFTERLVAHLARTGSVFRVDAGVVTRHLGRDAAQRGVGDPGRAELTGWLHGVECDHDRVIYQADAEDTAWSRLCLSQADVAVLVAPAGDDPSIGAVEARALATDSLRCELALLHGPGTAGAAAAWLTHRPVADHHHLRDGQPADVARLARMITGTGCGLVLGGGGARGFVHLGVIRALEEAGVPIDVVGGTSSGALIAAVCALGLDDAERVRRITDLGSYGRRLVTPTLPLIALSSGRRVDRLLSSHLGATLIEDLPLRFFCISANLTRAEEVIHERGPLWTAVRASLSLPGVYPPVCAGGDLFVDGAALDNLPVGVMRGRIGDGSIVAVDLSTEVEPLTTAPFEAGLSGWRVLGGRLNPFGPPRPLPSIADILSRSTGLSQVRRRREALDSDRVDLLLRPPVAALGTLDFKGGISLIEAGYRHAADALSRSGLAERFAR
jgi:NTE family protein